MPALSESSRQLIALGAAATALAILAYRTYNPQPKSFGSNSSSTAAVGSTGETRSLYASQPVPQTKTLYERLGGEAAVEAAVEKFYKRMLSDERTARFFRNTNMAKQHAKQVSFMSTAFGAPKKFSGLAMDKAHRRLIKEEGMTDFHYDATCENLDKTLEEMGVGQDLRTEVRVALETLREQVMCRGKWAMTE